MLVIVVFFSLRVISHMASPHLIQTKLFTSSWFQLSTSLDLRHSFCQRKCEKCRAQSICKNSIRWQTGSDLWYSEIRIVRMALLIFRLLSISKHTFNSIGLYCLYSIVTLRALFRCDEAINRICNVQILEQFLEQIYATNKYETTHKTTELQWVVERNRRTHARYCQYCDDGVFTRI